LGLKTRGPCKRRAEFCSLFRGLADFVRRIGVEMALADRLEADIGGLPYAEHDGVATVASSRPARSMASAASFEPS